MTNLMATFRIFAKTRLKILRPAPTVYLCFVWISIERRAGGGGGRKGVDIAPRILTSEPDSYMVGEGARWHRQRTRRKQESLFASAGHQTEIPVLPSPILVITMRQRSWLYSVHTVYSILRSAAQDIVVNLSPTCPGFNPRPLQVGCEGRIDMGVGFSSKTLFPLHIFIPPTSKNTPILRHIAECRSLTF
jgi:hypothetical protein